MPREKRPPRGSTRCLRTSISSARLRLDTRRWYRDPGDSNGKPHDAGFDISFDQQISEHLRPFFRYGTGEGNINGIKNMVSGGIGWEGKLLFNSDVVGLGGSWG